MNSSKVVFFRKITVCSWLCGALLASVPMVAAKAQGVGMVAPEAMVHLQASASVDVAKDVLSMVLTTTREGVEAAAVQAGLKQALDSALREALKVARPGQVDVQTGHFSLWPRYGKEGKVNGWLGSADLLLEGLDMAAIAQLAGRITSMSVGRVSTNISRDLREKTESALLAQAIARFSAKAAAATQQFGYARHSVREVTLGDSEPPPMPQDGLRMKSLSAENQEALPIEAGRATVTVSVSGSVQMLR